MVFVRDTCSLSYVRTTPSETHTHIHHSPPDASIRRLMNTSSLPRAAHLYVPSYGDTLISSIKSTFWDKIGPDRTTQHFGGEFWESSWQTQQQSTSWLEGGISIGSPFLYIYVWNHMVMDLSRMRFWCAFHGLKEETDQILVAATLRSGQPPKSLEKNHITQAQKLPIPPVLSIGRFSCLLLGLQSIFCWLLAQLDWLAFFPSVFARRWKWASVDTAKSTIILH